MSMKNIFKKHFVPILCMALAATMMTVGVLADSGTSQGQRPDRQRGPGMQQGAPGGGWGEAGDSALLTQIKEKIEALEDEGKKADLTALLKAYQEALSAEKAAFEAAASAAQDTLEPLRKAAADARTALVSALSEAGIDIMGRGGNSESRNDGKKADDNRKGRNGLAFGTLDTKAIETQITKLDDSAARENLTALLKAYTEALEAERAGVKNNSLTDDQKEALRETLTAAADKLTEALDTAGIGSDSYTRRPGDTGGSTVPSEPPAQASSAASTDSSGTAKTGFFQKLADWFSSWGK